MKAVAKRFHDEDASVDVSYFASAESSPTAQQAILRELTRSSVHAALVMPVDPMSIKAEIDTLVSDGIRVVVIGTDVPNSNRVLFLGPAEMALGEATATACARVISGERRSVMLLHAGAEHAAYGLRYSGFRLQSQAEPAIEIFKELDCGGHVTEAQRIVRRQMRLYPRLGCWAFLDDWPIRNWSSGERLVPPECAVVVCRDDPAYFEAMRRGEIDALISYDLYDCVERGIRTAIRLADDREGEFLTTYYVPPQIVTRDDLAWHASRWNRWREGLPAPARPTE